MQAQSCFIIGTDTNVGKTYVASRIITQFVKDGFKTVGMKPIASGCELGANGELINEDVTALSHASNVKAPLDLINPYRFQPAIAPHIAAQKVGVEMNIVTILSAFETLKNQADIVVVEGAGGFLVPINQTQTLADLAVALKLPIILVVGMRLGCINHALLTVEAIETRGLHLAGWVANQIDHSMPEFEENLESLKTRIDAPLLEIFRWKS
jgi:dethiobiotin synthetase